jgi:hypothetical protein
MARDRPLICLAWKQEYFRKRDWTGQISLIRFNKSGFTRKTTP